MLADSHVPSSLGDRREIVPLSSGDRQAPCLRLSSKPHVLSSSCVRRSCWGKRNQNIVEEKVRPVAVCKNAGLLRV